MPRRAPILLLAALLAGCGSQPVPDVAYYRMPEPAAPAAREQPAFRIPIVVDVFLADGMHGEQAILYALKPDASVKAYHYQFWNDPPVRLLQRRLIRHLREANMAPLTADRLASSLESVRVGGVIERFERVQRAQGEWEAVVAIELRVDHGDQGLPLLLETYSATVPAEGESIQATVRAMAEATDTVFARFLDDLGALRP